MKQLKKWLAAMALWALLVWFAITAQGCLAIDAALVVTHPAGFR